MGKLPSNVRALSPVYIFFFQVLQSAILYVLDLDVLEICPFMVATRKSDDAMALSPLHITSRSFNFTDTRSVNNILKHNMDSEKYNCSKSLRISITIPHYSHTEHRRM